MSVFRAKGSWLGRRRAWCTIVVALSSSVAYAESEESPLVGSLGDLPADQRAVLATILQQAGVKQVKARSVERTPERQVRVMLNLAREDMERAKSMYCDAGDEVLAHFDAKASRDKNEAAMLQSLLAVLPRAREMGCLNHVRNSDVISVDVLAEDVPEEKREALVKAAEAAVVAKKLERFLAPPREPEAYHFEFKRSGVSPVPEAANASPPTQ